MSIAAAIFVKTPGCSPVKTRLAESMGTAAARELYCRSVECVAASVAASPLIAYWAVAEPDGIDDRRWSGFPRLLQPSGSLGVRMGAIHDRLREHHDGVVLLGGDLPQLEPGQLDTAAAWLNNGADRHVLGPARDGGFWLYGSNAEDPARNWDTVRYSRPDTGERFRHATGGRPEHWMILDARTDIDQVEDLAAAGRELGQLANPTPSQRAFHAWLKSHTRVAS